MTLSGTDFTSAARQLAVKRRTSQESGGFFFAQVEYGDPLGWFPLARHKVTWYVARRHTVERLHHAVPTSSMISSNSTLNVPLVAWREIALAFRRRAARKRRRVAAAAAYAARTAVLTIHIQLHRRQKGPQVAVVTAARPLHNFSPPLCTTICTTSTWTSSYPRLYLPGHALPTT